MIKCQWNYLEKYPFQCMWIFVKNRPNVLHILGQTLGPILLQYHCEITCKVYVINNELFQQQSTSPMFPVIFGSVVCSVAIRKLKRKDSQGPQTVSNCPLFSWPLPRLRSLKLLDAIQFCFYTRIYFLYFVRYLVPFSVVSILHTVRIVWKKNSHSSYGRC